MGREARTTGRSFAGIEVKGRACFLVGKIYNIVAPLVGVQEGPFLW